jgi:hypothetical protein
MKHKTVALLSPLYIVGMIAFAAQGADAPKEQEERTGATKPDIRTSQEDFGELVSDEAYIDIMLGNKPPRRVYTNGNVDFTYTASVMTQVTLPPSNEDIDAGRKGSAIWLPVSPEELQDVFILPEGLGESDGDVLPESEQFAYANQSTNETPYNGSDTDAVAAPRADQDEYSTATDQGGNDLVAARAVARCHMINSCDAKGNCKTRYSGLCPDGGICAKVSVPNDDGGVDETCRCVPKL